nr:Gag-Pol polyprotein [Tanacetum cinerariifolium]
GLRLLVESGRQAIFGLVLALNKARLKFTCDCTHIHVLGDGAQMLGSSCLNGKDPERMRRIYRNGDALHILRDEIGKGMSILYQLVFAYDANNNVNITFVLRPTENVISGGWGNGQVTHPDVNIAFALRQTKDVIPKIVKPTSSLINTRKIKESLNVTFADTYPPSKTSPLVDNDLDEEEAIKATEKQNLENVVEDETLEIDDIVNVNESKNHPLENVIGNLSQRTLRSQAQNQSNFFCFISTIEPKNVNEALGDESWIVAMQEELNQFIANDV